MSSYRNAKSDTICKTNINPNKSNVDANINSYDFSFYETFFGTNNSTNIQSNQSDKCTLFFSFSSTHYSTKLISNNISIYSTNYCPIDPAYQ